MSNRSQTISRRELVAALGVAGGGAALLSACRAAESIPIAERAATVRPRSGEPLAKVIRCVASSNRYIHLPEGEFTLTEPISIPSGTVLLGCGSRTVLRLARGFNDTAAFLLKDAGDISIGNFVLDCSAVGGKIDGIYAVNLKHFLFENIHLVKCPSRAIDIWGKSESGIIRNCVVIESGDRGIVIGGASNCLVEGCINERNGAHGIWVLSGARSIVLLNNISRDNRGNGIELIKNPELCTVAFNHCHGNTLGIHCYMARRTLLLGNTSHDNRSNGIDCNNCEEMRIIGNHCERNGSPRTEENKYEGTGILLFRTRDSLVVGNICANNDQGNSHRSGIALMDDGEEGLLCERNTVVGNICLDNQEKPTQKVGIRVGRTNSKCPDNLIVGNSIGRHPGAAIGGNRQGNAIAAHNWYGEFPRPHPAVEPRIPTVEKLPQPQERWHGRIVLLAGTEAEVPYLCRREKGELKWVKVGT